MGLTIKIEAKANDSFMLMVGNSYCNELRCKEDATFKVQMKLDILSEHQKVDGLVLCCVGPKVSKSFSDLATTTVSPLTSLSIC